MPPTAPSLWTRFRRWCMLVSVALVIGYVLLLLLMIAREDNLIFSPYPAQNWWPAVQADTQEVELHLADGTPIHAWWQPAENALGTALFFHGSGGNVSYAQSYDGWRDELPLNVLLVEYPGYGKSGGHPSEAGCYAAADAGYDWLVGTHKVPTNEVLIMGESLGGAVAIDLASRKPHRALIVTKTLATMPQVAGHHYPFLPVQFIMRNRFDSLSKVSQCTRPLFMAHSSADMLIPLEHAQKLFAAANEPKELITLDTLSHNDFTAKGLGPRLRQFLAQHAPTPGDRTKPAE